MFFKVKINVNIFLIVIVFFFFLLKLEASKETESQYCFILEAFKTYFYIKKKKGMSLNFDDSGVSKI